MVDLPNRKSFSPGAGWYVGDLNGMTFLDGAFLFAVEVRSENDSGPVSEREITGKLADYLAAGTLVV
jgi:hypothetical protein